MIEIRLHGRGGQGVKKAAQILGRAAFLTGYQTQDFSLYGAEREGAPLTGFVRLDKNTIPVVGNIENPDFILVLDDGLKEEIWSKGLKPAAKVLVNSANQLKRKNFFAVDASSTAFKFTQNPQANIALLGAFAKLFPVISLTHLEQAIKSEMPKLSEQQLNQNISAMKECFKQVNA